jgi:hypothetical protein
MVRAFGGDTRSLPNALIHPSFVLVYPRRPSIKAGCEFIRFVISELTCVSLETGFSLELVGKASIVPPEFLR